MSIKLASCHKKLNPQGMNKALEITWGRNLLLNFFFFKKGNRQTTWLQYGPRTTSYISQRLKTYDSGKIKRLQKNESCFTENFIIQRARSDVSSISFATCAALCA